MSTLLKRSAPCLLKAAVYEGYDYGLSLTYLEGGTKDIFLASVSDIEHTEWTEATVTEALQPYSLYDPHGFAVSQCHKHRETLINSD
ncbi:hypothetical protein K5D68_03525 [Pseudomonas cichorii]|nr:hypothetical protein [Pseudomonas cichorii]MBX8584065.1 hypothetical protein [Pseudomonas cichorii]